MYQSDITQFLQQLKAQKPTLEAERAKQSRVDQSAYVYYQKF